MILCLLEKLIIIIIIKKDINFFFSFTPTHRKINNFLCGENQIKRETLGPEYDKMRQVSFTMQHAFK